MRSLALNSLIAAVLTLTGATAFPQAAPTAQTTQVLAVTRSDEVVPPTIADLVLMLQSYAPDLGRVERLRAELHNPLPSTEDHFDLARAWHLRSRAALELGQVAVGFDALKQAEVHAAKVSSTGGRDDIGDLSRIRQELALATRLAAGTGEAIAVFEQFIGAYRATRPGMVIGPMSQLANNYLATGNLDRVNALIADMGGLIQVASSGRNSSFYAAGWRNRLEISRGRWLMAQGKFEAAELAFLQGLRQAEDEVRYMAIMRGGGRYGRTQADTDNTVDQSRRQLARVYLAQQRLDEAELWLRDILKSSLQRNGRNAQLTANTLHDLARVIQARGRNAEALVIAQWSEQSLQEAGFGPDSLDRIQVRRLRADLLSTLGRFPEAVTLYDQLRQTAEVEARGSDQVAFISPASVRAYLEVGRTAEALSDSAKLLADCTRWYGAEHEATAEARAFHAMALYRGGQRAQAKAEFERAVPILLSPASLVGKDQASAVRTTRLRRVLNGYVETLVGGGGERTEADIAQAFRVADVARWQSVQKALSGSALRAAAGTPELGNRIRAVQDGDDELQAVYKNLIAQRSAPADKQLPAVIAAMEQRIATLKRERTSHLAEIRREFPQYDALVNPMPADQAAAARALKPNEALLSIYTTEGGSYVWAQGPEGGLRFHFSPHDRAWVAERVKRLRQGVDLDRVDDIRRLGFDLEAAGEIHRELLAPVQSAWARADTLLVVANEALGQIPFALLPEGPATATPSSPQSLPLAQYRAVPWLGRKVAIAYLPSVSALVTLRALPASRAKRSPFIGFGDPDFGGTRLAQAGSARGVRNLGITRQARWDDSAESPEALAARTRAGAEAAGTPVLTPLPDTRDEILAIATALKADRQRDVIFGPLATPAAVTGSDLKQRQVVAFATHGLVAGDLPGLDQPALALAPPAGKPLQAGLLKMEDILKLSLDADLVVLSACNTAAADGSGSEAVSGLGRAFFYAGSRSVLATHWPVESVSARQLVTELFERYAREGGLTRAKALQQAMLELMDKGVDLDEKSQPSFAYAHPAFWAPYALYGDPGR